MGDTPNAPAPAMQPQAKRSVRRLWILLLLLLALPAAYLLSIGPAAFAWKKFNLPDEGPVADVVFELYAPLRRIPEDSAMGKALKFYMRIWEPTE